VVAHSAITDFIGGVDVLMLRLNLLLRLVVSFLPFATTLLAEYVHEKGAERVAVTVYGVTLLATSSVMAALWRYAIRAHLARPDADMRTSAC
jgi:uncharacterized membrane protein